MCAVAPESRITVKCPGVSPFDTLGGGVFVMV